MKTDWAEQNLQVIRTLMERSTIYQRALGPIMWWIGGLATVSAAMGWWQAQSDGYYGDRFFLHWTLTSVVAMGGAFGLARRQARKEGEAFWSPAARRVAQALLPAVVVGLIVTGFLWKNGLYAHAPMVGLWAMLYGCAVHAAGFFAPRGLRALGWVAIACGLGWWVWTTGHDVARSHVAMGAIFGGLHLGYAVYLTVIKREP
jgi:hypothetical protein